MNFSEKIDNLLKVNKLGINSIQEMESFCGLGMNTIRKAYNDKREMSAKSTRLLLEKMGINREWWDRQEGGVWRENLTSVGNDEQFIVDTKRYIATLERNVDLMEKEIRRLEARLKECQGQIQKLGL